ncbi:MAG: CHAD domain-containing protein [Proteobacteria bacterium]|nr:CHAD domain-containing protein [Pseudomonadota bacterium]
MTRQTSRSATRAAAKTPALQWRARILAILEDEAPGPGDLSLSPPRRVQRVRRATKAAQALLRLAPKALRPRALGTRMVLGTARRLLSQTRDTDALIETFTALAPRAKLNRAQGAALRKLLEQNQASRHASVEEDLARTANLFRQASDQVRRYQFSETAGRAILAGISRDYRKLYRDMRAAFSDDDIEALHELRKRVVVHRQHAAFVGSLCHRPFWTRRAERARELHEALGDHRDLALLDDCLRPQQNPKLTPAIAKVLRVIEIRQDDLISDAHKAARKLMVLKPRQLKDKIRESVRR